MPTGGRVTASLHTMCYSGWRGQESNLKLEVMSLPRYRFSTPQCLVEESNSHNQRVELVLYH